MSGMEWGKFKRNQNLRKPEPNSIRYNLITRRQVDLLVKFGKSKAEVSGLTVAQASKLIKSLLG